MICCFFGHRDVSEDIIPILEDTIVRLIEENGVRSFLVGNHGDFDNKVYRVLKKIKVRYPIIKFSVVLAYMQSGKDYHGDSIYPEGLETVPPRFAISYRNRWMIENSEYVVVYVKRDFGGAVQFYELAKRKGRKVINIAE